MSSMVPTRPGFGPGLALSRKQQCTNTAPVCILQTANAAGDHGAWSLVYESETLANEQSGSMCPGASAVEAA